MYLMSLIFASFRTPQSARIGIGKKLGTGSGEGGGARVERPNGAHRFANGSTSIRDGKARVTSLLHPYNPR